MHNDNNNTNNDKAERFQISLAGEPCPFLFQGAPGQKEPRSSCKGKP